MKHDRASGVNEVDMPFAGKGVGGWRFAVCTQQHLGVVNVAHLLVVDGHESHLLKAVALLAVVYDVAQTIELSLFGELLFCLSDGSRHTEAEA